MKKLIVVLGLVLFACGHLQPVQPLPRLTKAQWHDDLRTFAREIPQRHKNAFHHITREQFTAMVSDLDRRIDTSNDDEIVVGFMALDAAIGDGHTRIAVPANWRRLPLIIRPFEGEYRVIGASDAALVGARVLRIGDMPLADVLAKFRTILPQDETDSLVVSSGTGFFSVPEILHGLGIVKSADSVSVTTDAGTTEVAAVAKMPPNAAMHWVAAHDPVSRGHEGETFYFHYFEPEKLLYVNWRSYQDLRRKVGPLWHFVDAHDVKTIAIDLRQNGGGDYFVGRRYIINPLKSRPQRVFALVGTNTFSAALANACDFRYMLHATLVGVPIGERPNSYSELRTMLLPNSRLRAGYSVRYYEFDPGNAANVVEPDKTIGITWPEYAAGKDPALDWILATSSSTTKSASASR